MSQESGPSGRLRWWREPLLHLFVLGLAVFGLHALLNRAPEAPADPFIVEVSSSDVEWLRNVWKKRMGREPTVQELRGQLHQLIREQILNREAVAMGLDQGDMVVRRRLAQKVEFLLKDLSAMVEPSDAQLQQYLDRNRDRFEEPARISFSQVYFNVDRRGSEGAEQAARAAVQRLNGAGAGTSEPSALGDPSMLQSRCDDCTSDQVRASFGTRFADSVQDLASGSWHGPVESGYGLHAVHVEARQAAELPEFSAIRDRIAMEWMSEQQREGSRAAYEEIRTRYRVLVEGLPYDFDLSGDGARE